MLYLKIGFVILLIIFVGTFVYQNYSELSNEIVMRIPPLKKPLGPSPMILYFSLSLFVGMLLTGFPLFIMLIKSSSLIKKQARTINSLKNEISQLQLVQKSLSEDYDSSSDYQGEKPSEEDPGDSQE